MCGSGSQIAGTRSRCESTARTIESILSVLQASGARPLTFWASAISTSQPCCSSVSWTRRAPVIDSTTADRKSTRLNSSHQIISYAVFCLKKKKKKQKNNKYKKKKKKNTKT